MLTRYFTQDPFADFFRLQDQLLTRGAQRREEASRFVPAVDLYEDENALVFEMELPGLKAEDVDISLEKNVLTVTGERKLIRDDKGEGYSHTERRWGRFERSFRLADTLDTTAAEAEMNDGVLTVRLQKKAEEQPRKISIKGAGEKPELKSAA
jgi:HSP20 family protein